jgi:hypothetical protein
MKAIHTRVTPNIVTMFQMVNILVTIQSFEKKILDNEKRIKGCDNGANKYMPYYSGLKQSYQEAIKTFKERIAEEECAYNQLLNELTLLSLPEIEINIPERAPELLDHDNDIENIHHRQTCGLH